MNTNSIENIIQHILNPEFRCSILPRHLYTYIDFTTKGITRKILGGKESCLINIGERASQMNMETASVLILDPNQKIVCNHNFKIRTCYPPGYKKDQTPFLVDYTILLYQEPQGTDYCYSVWGKNDKLLTYGYAITFYKQKQLSKLSKHDFMTECGQLMKSEEIDYKGKTKFKIQYSNQTTRS
ncbi:hypothetical protein [Aquimarina aquimarini]|uniref:hypothetical protein n=1 Tax=Aquimarina aquimarini TaxID=1191734 RepID=UPI000D55C3F8|nr:hypothetical protein [Aquimarina aquimarini]